MTKAIYIRTSTEDQSPENQLNDCISMAGNDYELYKDKLSAWKDNIQREDFNRLKKNIKAHAINKLYVWDLDRLFRNRKKLIIFFNFCKAYKCKIYSFRQQWLKDINTMPEPWGEIVNDLMLQIMGWLAEEESQKRSDRVKASISKAEGITKSKYGNKWGRKEISTFKINKILDMRKENDKVSIRTIAKSVGCSVGVVHKILTGQHPKKKLE